MTTAVHPPVLPPLLTPAHVPSGVDPFAKAIAAATSGVDAGTVFYASRVDAMTAALVLAPETPLLTALQMIPVAMVGLGDAIGALAPPEVAVTWTWPDRLEINGAQAGIMRAAAAHQDLTAAPNWLVVSVTLQFLPFLHEPGVIADYTSLYDEGCSELGVTELIEAWGRHTLVWLNRWEDEGFKPVHSSWCGRTVKLGEAISLAAPGGHMIGQWRGMDEHGQALVETEARVECLALTTMLSEPSVWPPKYLTGDH